MKIILKRDDLREGKVKAGGGLLPALGELKFFIMKTLRATRLWNSISFLTSIKIVMYTKKNLKVNIKLVMHIIRLL